MKNWIKVLACVVLAFGFFFTSFGYAALTDRLSITGKAKIDIPSGVYIISHDGTSYSRLDVRDFSYYNYSTTVDTSLSKSERNREGTVTYTVTVLNNTEYEYAYRGLYYMSTYGNNSYVSTSNANNKLGVVVKFPDGNRGLRRKCLRIILNCKHLLHHPSDYGKNIFSGCNCFFSLRYLYNPIKHPFVSYTRTISSSVKQFRSESMDPSNLFPL